MTLSEKKTRAHVIPFAVFMLIMLVGQFAGEFGLKLDNEAQAWYRRRPEYLMMLLQIVIVFPMFFYWRKFYEWNFGKG